jgi:uncharacterized protein YndB with AHSA1/START domain
MTAETAKSTTGSTAESRLAPLEVQVTVARTPEAAFRLFTEETHTWWPLASHSVGQEEAEACIFEGREGGRIFERCRDGRTHTWGTVLAWEPPHRVAFTWHPGRGEETAQRVEVRFVPVGDEGTRVELTHRDWEVLGEKAEETRRGYEKGWAFVLGECYTGAA